MDSSLALNNFYFSNYKIKLRVTLEITLLFYNYLIEMCYLYTYYTYTHIWCGTHLTCTSPTSNVSVCINIICLFNNVDVAVLTNI
jgi:hypothetical protein